MELVYSKVIYGNSGQRGLLKSNKSRMGRHFTFRSPANMLSKPSGLPVTRLYYSKQSSFENGSALFHRSAVTRSNPWYFESPWLSEHFAYLRRTYSVSYESPLRLA